MSNLLPARISLAVALAVLAPTLRAAPAQARATDVQEAGSTKSLYLMLIRQARSDGRPRAALAYLDDFDRRHPDDLEARILRVNCLLDLGQTGEASAEAGKLPTDDRSGEVQQVRGHVFAAEKHWPDAIAQYEQALLLKPADPLTSNALGYARLQSGQFEAALENLRAAHDLAPDDTVIRNNLLLALTLADHAREAKYLFETIGDETVRSRIRRAVADEVNRLVALATVKVEAML
ncbi:tetratricopeptide repeat protein [Novosphingobium sp. PP1Y]|uniref:tetratricopeptide repeat protein n=1 Tax=Novosphingobium sp. PP1Y TaxID=702113 RepID=UPI00020EFBDE|nr:tetratricopeptide repeat protein [Novosphingobium sp. PP1Y]CCA90418.1 tetratricopeptide TPR_4 [Novosphingobium sp. PP1Y]